MPLLTGLEGYQYYPVPEPDLLTQYPNPHIAPVPNIAGMPPSPVYPQSISQVIGQTPISVDKTGLDTPSMNAGAGTAMDDWYKYAVLASLGGSAGAALGQAFRPRYGPPPPIAPPPGPRMDVTAPASLSYLAATRRKR